MTLPATPGSIFDGLPDAVAKSAASAVAALQRGDAAVAADALQSLLGQAPEHVGLLRLTGMAERHRGNLDVARQLLLRAEELAPDDALVASSLGLTSLQSGAVEAGLSELRRACDLAPQVATMWNNLGKALLDHQRLAEAIAPLQRAVALDGGLRPARYALAYALGNDGDIDGAAAQYRALLALRRDDGEAWIGLAQLKRQLLGADDLAVMQAQLARKDLHPADRIALEYACADTLHGRGEYAAAFAAWQRANAGVRARHPWDRQAFVTHADAALAQDWPVATAGDLGRRVLFVVGLPRSGTSIVEQILACHSQVVAAGESEALGQVLRAEAQRRGGNYPQALAGLTATEWKRLGQDYLGRLAARLPPGSVVSDKLPGNWLYLGAALAMLPNARVIVCRRDPVEVGFSCFRQRFGGAAQGFSYALEDIGLFWRHFDAAIRHWRAHRPAQVFELAYEALVADPEPSIRTLLDFCDLPFEVACLHPERNPRAVRTMSATQVRRPLRPGTAVADRYGALLDPLRAALLGPVPD